jgi:hypothetical protein
MQACLHVWGTVSAVWAHARTYFCTITLFVTSTVRSLQTIPSRETYLLKISNIFHVCCTRNKCHSHLIFYYLCSTAILCGEYKLCSDVKLRVTVILRQRTLAEESDAPSVKSDQPITRSLALLLRCQEQRFPKWMPWSLCLPWKSRTRLIVTLYAYCLSCYNESFQDPGLCPSPFLSLCVLAIPSVGNRMPTTKCILSVTSKRFFESWWCHINF